MQVYLRSNHLPPHNFFEKAYYCRAIYFRKTNFGSLIKEPPATTSAAFEVCCRAIRRGICLFRFLQFEPSVIAFQVDGNGGCSCSAGSAISPCSSSSGAAVSITRKYDPKTEIGRRRAGNIFFSFHNADIVVLQRQR